MSAAAEAVEDADDTDAELGAEGVPLDGDDAGDVYVTVCEEVKDTVPATLRAEAGDGAEASEHATAVEAGDWVEFIAAADAEEDAAREEVPPAEERRAAIKATAAPLRRPPEEGFQCGTATRLQHTCNTLAHSACTACIEHEQHALLRRPQAAGGFHLEVVGAMWSRGAWDSGVCEDRLWCFLHARLWHQPCAARCGRAGGPALPGLCASRQMWGGAGALWRPNSAETTSAPCCQRLQ